MNHHTTALTRITAMAAILIGINVQAKAQTYVSFDADPHATFPSRIDSSGRIVGLAFHQDQTYGGFVRNTDGSIVWVNYPGALETDWLGFAAAGQIAGRYMDSPWLKQIFT